MVPLCFRIVISNSVSVILVRFCSLDAFLFKKLHSPRNFSDLQDKKRFQRDEGRGTVIPEGQRQCLNCRGCRRCQGRWPSCFQVWICPRQGASGPESDLCSQSLRCFLPRRDVNILVFYCFTKSLHSSHLELSLCRSGPFVHVE